MEGLQMDGSRSVEQFVVATKGRRRQRAFGFGNDENDAAELVHLLRHRPRDKKRPGQTGPILSKWAWSLLKPSGPFLLRPFSGRAQDEL
ncbi:hypothetical protein AAC387_Pa04g1989 [Persea americana]